MSDFYHLSARSIDGQDIPMSHYTGKTILVVNVASKCGFTPQYTGLEAIYQRFKDKGFTTLGFPCNQFGQQEPGSENEIKEFCSLNYPVSFPMFAKVDVNGTKRHPIYAFLTSQKKGVLGTEAIKWNFTKFLVDRNGQVVGRYAPQTKPEDLVGDIESLL